MAQRPLTIEQLELMLEILLDDEVLNMENDIRTIHSSLFSLQRAGEPEGYPGDNFVVTLRHSSLYEFFKTSNKRETEPIEVNPERFEVMFVFVLLYSCRWTPSPQSNRSLGAVWAYAEAFLPQHLMRADPGKAGNLQGRISTCLPDVFAKIQGGDSRFISTVFYRDASRFEFYPSSTANPLTKFWFGTEDRGVANNRAQLVLNWLLPASREIFETCARSSTVVSDVCPFTVLFAPMVVSLANQWLRPDKLDASDGSAWIIPVLLGIYGEMAGTIDLSSHYGRAPDIELGLTDFTKQLLPVYSYLPSWGISTLAELQQFQKTAIWHARLGQALLLHGNYKEAIDHLRIALSFHDKNPSLSSQSLSVIHRDMSRACFEELYKEALEYSHLAESLNCSGTAETLLSDPMGQLLNIAQLKHRANLPDQATAAANEAWEVYQRKGDDRDWRVWSDFLAIFTELQQPDRLRAAFEFAATFFNSRQNIETEEHAVSIIESAFAETSTIHKAIRLGLTSDDEECLRFVSWATEKLNKTRHDIMNVTKAKYLMGSLLFEKGQFAAGIRTWRDTVSISSVDWLAKQAQEQSLSHLVAVCLYHPELPLPGDMVTLALDADVEYSDMCLVLPSWLWDRGDIENARKALCGRVKECMAFLSDDHPTIDGHTWASLFRTFLISTDSDEDLRIALYMMKAWRGIIGVYIRKPDTEVELEATNPFKGMHLEDEKASAAKEDNNMDLEWNGVWDWTDTLTKCASCQLEVACMSYWYFCRFCPHTALCARCYPSIRSNNSNNNFLSQTAPSTCSPQHVFYYSGKPLMSSECLKERLVPLTSTSPGGQMQVMQVEDWKAMLEKKWGTKKFQFEGGFLTWGMQVLPEVQKARRATLFKV